MLITFIQNTVKGESIEDASIKANKYNRYWNTAF